MVFYRRVFGGHWDRWFELIANGALAPALVLLQEKQLDGLRMVGFLTLRASGLGRTGVP